MILLITGYCNRSCVYCFETGTLGSRAKAKLEISESDFESLCNWSAKNNVRGMCLVGGEPTLHSNFESIVERFLGMGMNLVLISNLICKPTKLDVLHDDRVKVLVNASQEDENTEKLRGRFESNLEKLAATNRKLVLSYTLFELDQDFQYVLDYAQRFDIREVRLDVARPTLHAKTRCVMARELPAFKPKMLEIIDACEQHGLDLRFDCFFPPSHFSAEEIKRYRLRDKGLRTDPNCNFVVINPDLTIGTCPHYHLIDRKVTEYENPRELTRDVVAHVAAKRRLRNLGYCAAEDYMVEHD